MNSLRRRCVRKAAGYICFVATILLAGMIAGCAGARAQRPLEWKADCKPGAVYAVDVSYGNYGEVVFKGDLEGRVVFPVGPSGPNRILSAEWRLRVWVNELPAGGYTLSGETLKGLRIFTSLGPYPTRAEAISALDDLCLKIVLDQCVDVVMSNAYQRFDVPVRIRNEKISHYSYEFGTPPPKEQ